MKYRFILICLICCSFPVIALADNNEGLREEVKRLQEQTIKLQEQLNHLQTALVVQSNNKSQDKPKAHKTKVIKSKIAKPTVQIPDEQTQEVSSYEVPEPKEEKLKVTKKPSNHIDANGNVKNDIQNLPQSESANLGYHKSQITVHRPDVDPESLDFYPTALVADERVVTYIAGTPVVTSPFLGSRPAFDGSDYIVNISSINRDIRLMQQRRRLYRAYESMGYQAPQKPILALSGKVVPSAAIGNLFESTRVGDITLGSGELDLAGVLNDTVEAYMAFAYDASPPDIGGQRVANSIVELNMGFVNIGNLDKSPFYFTGGQIFVPFGRFSTSMVSAPLTMIMSRTKARPFILGYKSQQDSGPFAAIYGYRTDTVLNSRAAGGANLGYIIDTDNTSTEIGVSFINAIDDAGGMQFTGAVPNTTFGGFGSFTNGSELVSKIPAFDAHLTMSFDRINITAEWLTTTKRFGINELSYNGRGAMPQSGQLEAGITFFAFNKPSTFSLGYQWTREALALNLPQQRYAGVFNISIWKDTIESLEYRHDINYNKYQYANGASPAGVTNLNTIGPGGSADTLLLQIGVYF